MSCPGHYCARCDDARYDGWIGCKRCEDRLDAALAKAEAERDEARIELQHLKLATLAALTKAGLAMLEENPITPSEVESAIRRLARERDSERARAERYLAAMREGVA